jgi:hypothetical protein
MGGRGHERTGQLSGATLRGFGAFVKGEGGQGGGGRGEAVWNLLMNDVGA